MQQSLPKSIEEELKDLPEDASEKAIEETAKRLENAQYFPLPFMDNSCFFRMKRADIAQEVNRIWQKSYSEARDEAAEQMCNLKLHLLLSHYRELDSLRRNDPDAWDNVNELSLED